MRINLLTILASLAVSVSGAWAQAISANELILEKGVASHAKIDDVYRRFSDAYRKLDPKAVTNLYTDDAFYLAPGSEIKQGREKILADFSSFFNSVRDTGGNLSISFRILDRRVSRDLAYDVGIYTLAQMRPNSNVRTSTGKFVVVARRMNNGGWRFHIDSYSGLPNEDRAQAVEEMKIPFELYQGRIYVKTFVNERGPFRFMIDTGASGMGRADVRLVNNLSLKATGTTTNSDGINTSTVATVEAGSISLGQLTRRNVELLSRDYNTRPSPALGVLYGIIGREFFEEYLLTIDYEKKEIVLSNDFLSGSTPNVMQYKTAFYVPVNIGKHEAVVFLDTGSTLEMHLPKHWAEKLQIRNLKDAGEGRKANTVLRLFSAELPVSVKIGGNVISKVNANFSDLADRINLGGAFLERNRCVLSIDQKNQLVRLLCREFPINASVS